MLVPKAARPQLGVIVLEVINLGLMYWRGGVADVRVDQPVVMALLLVRFASRGDCSSLIVFLGLDRTIREAPHLVPR